MASRVDDIGDIVRRVREARGLNLLALAKFARLNRSIVERLEHGKTGKAADKRRAMEAISAVLGDKTMMRNLQLGRRQLETLGHLTEADINRHAAEEEFAWLDDEELFSQPPRALSGLVDELAREHRPAMIIDPLLFIYAMNDLVPKLLEFDPMQWLNNWEMWHLIGRKMRPDAPPRMRYIDDDHFIQTISYFFQRPESNRFFFTPQMARLLDRLDDLAEEHNHPFVRRWDAMTKFMTDLELRSMPRELTRPNGQRMRTEAKRINEVVVPFGNDTEMTFALVGWEAVDDVGRKMLSDWRGSATRGRVLFAREFDRKREFHVNRWPELTLGVNPRT